MTDMILTTMNDLPGYQIEEVLQEAGYGEEEIRRLMADGAVAGPATGVAGSFLG